jgi:hypothetical protein
MSIPPPVTPLLRAVIKLCRVDLPIPPPAAPEIVFGERARSIYFSRPPAAFRPIAPATISMIKFDNRSAHISSSLRAVGSNGPDGRGLVSKRNQLTKNKHNCCVGRSPLSADGQRCYAQGCKSDKRLGKPSGWPLPLRPWSFYGQWLRYPLAFRILVTISITPAENLPCGAWQEG